MASRPSQRQTAAGRPHLRLYRIICALPGPRPTLLLAAALGIAGLPVTAAARDPLVHYAIPAGPLHRALLLFARQGGMQILFTPDLVTGRRARAITGRLSPEAALAALLTGSGLVARQLPSGAMLIVRAEGSRPLPAADIDPPGTAIAEDIVVTAYKYPSTLAASPAGITVLTGQAADRRGVDDLATLARQVPALQVADTGDSDARLSLRGVNAQGEPTVGLYLGDTPVTGPSGTTFDPGWISPDIELVDVDRMELLRGPQGTLYGASSMGGTLRILFNRADPAGLAARAEGGIALLQGGGIGHNASATVNLPLVEGRAALRGTGWRRRIAGFVDHLRFGISDQGHVTRQGGRLNLGWLPATGMDASLTVLYQESRTDGAAAWDERAGRLVNPSPVRTAAQDRLTLASLTVNRQAGWGTITATGSIYRWDVQKQRDFTAAIGANITSPDGCRRWLALPATGTCDAAQQAGWLAYAGGRLPAILHQPMDVDSASGELRLHVDRWAGTRVTAGVFAETRRDRVTSITALADATTGLLLRPLDETGRRTIRTGLDQIALFGEGTHDLTATIALTAGLRLYHYHREASGRVDLPNPVTGTGDIAPGRFVSSEDGMNWQGRLAWSPSSTVRAYLQVADGFRPGGVNITPGLTAQERTYRSDALRSHEAGLQWRKGAVDLRASVFHIDWRNMIGTVISANSAFAYNTNVADVDIDGAEWSMALAPAPGWTLAVSGGWTDARLAEDQAAPSARDGGRAGDRLAHVPRFSGLATVQWQGNIGLRTRLDARLDLSGRSAIASQLNAGFPGYARTPGRMQLDAAVGADQGGWRLSITVRNVLDDQRADRVLMDALGQHQLYGPTPRTVQVEVLRRI